MGQGGGSYQGIGHDGRHKQLTHITSHALLTRIVRARYIVYIHIIPYSLTHLSRKQGTRPPPLAVAPRKLATGKPAETKRLPRPQKRRAPSPSPRA